MSYPVDTQQALLFLGFDPDKWSVVSGDEHGRRIPAGLWLDPAPIPTEQEITDTLASAAYLTWRSEHGGNPTLTAQRRAKDEGIDGGDPLSIAQRAELGERNSRDNYLATRIEELQVALGAMKSSNGGVANLRAAIPASWSPTATRLRADARQDLRDEIDSGQSNT